MALPLPIVVTLLLVQVGALLMGFLGPPGRRMRPALTILLLGTGLVLLPLGLGAVAIGESRTGTLMVWCGDRNGRVLSKESSVRSLPATLWILVVSSASSMLSGGMIVGRRFAIIVLPAPGGPIRMTLCPPAAAISKARLMFSWPFTSLRSTE